MYSGHCSVSTKLVTQNTPPPGHQISPSFAFFSFDNVKQCTMTQLDLSVATRASQAALLPVVLIASSINEARPLVAPSIYG